jgi:hypothetical protein
VADALDGIARDAPARSRFLAFARDADDPAIRARMIKLAHRLGWLTADEEPAELAALIGDRIAGNVSPADVELACSLNDGHELDAALPALAAASGAPTLGQTAMLACLGSAEARAKVLPALTSAHHADFEVAQVYLSHRPLTDVQELRRVTIDIANAPDPNVQVRALDTLACQHVSDPESLNELARLFPLTKSADVQAAIAGVLLRSDYEAIATPDVVQNLRENQIDRGTPCSKVIDALIRHLDTR